MLNHHSCRTLHCWRKEWLLHKPQVLQNKIKGLEKNITELQKLPIATPVTPATQNIDQMITEPPHATLHGMSNKTTKAAAEKQQKITGKKKTK